MEMVSAHLNDIYIYRSNVNTIRNLFSQFLGTMWLNDGRVYAGQWINNLKEGKGTFQRKYGGKKFKTLTAASEASSAYSFVFETTI